MVSVDVKHHVYLLEAKVWMCVSTCVCVCVHACMYVCVCLCMCVCACVHKTVCSRESIEAKVWMCYKSSVLSNYITQDYCV